MTRIASYLSYRFQSQNRHGVHSPFVYKLLDEVIYKSRLGMDPAVENLRKFMLQNHTILEISDHGAGSRATKSNRRSISDITSVSTSAPKISFLLSRLIRYFNFKNVVELGTNTGINAAYMAKAAEGGTLITIEGDKALAALAEKNLNKLHIDNCIVMTGLFDAHLPEALKKLDRVDFAYIDGNHRYQPTIEYFEQISKYCHNDSVIAIGDIHWSGEMDAAWKAITATKKCTVSIDLFSMGLVFFRREQVSQNFIIRF